MIKRKKEIATMVIAGLFLSFGVISAQVQETRGAAPPVTPVREALSSEAMRERAKEHMERFEAERQRMHEETQTRREEHEAKVREMREAATQEIERRKQEFREKLAQIREERHRMLAEKLSEQMNRVNQHMSDAALNYLDALSLVLDKIEARTGIVQDAAGADLTDMGIEIAAARQRIEEAREAVLAQKSKEYILTIESQETLGQDIRNSMQELRNDHRRLRQEVLHPLRNLIHDVMLTMKEQAEQSGEEAVESLNEEFNEQ